MRSETRGAVLAFLRNPTKAAFSAVEPFEDEVVSYFSSVVSSGGELDDELLQAFDVCVLSTPPDMETAELIGEFMRRFCDHELFAPDPAQVKAVLGECDNVEELSDEEVDALRVAASPPPLPTLARRVSPLN